MSRIICVTDRKLCEGDLNSQIKKAIYAGADTVVLREKDLGNAEYTELAQEVIKTCRNAGARCFLHGHAAVSFGLDADGLHLPLQELSVSIDSGTGKNEIPSRSTIGTSCHSVAEALLAERLGCSYIFAGHIFDTECKAGMPGRGLDFLKEITSAVSIPVFAIGGISPDNFYDVIDAGAEGACIMSGFMKDPPLDMRKFT